MTLRLDIADFGRPLNPAPRVADTGRDATRARPNRPTTSIRREILAGVAGMVAMVGILGGWAVATSFSGAVIAPGVLVVESSSKKIQSATASLVREVLVDNGDRVEAGDLLVRLDDTVARANLTILSRSVDEFTLRRSRLLAERDGTAALALPPEIVARAATEPELAKLIAAEQRVFELRATVRRNKRDQLEKRIEQARQMVRSLEAQSAAKEHERDLLQAEFDTVEGLFRKNLVGLQRVGALNRDTARVAGELAQLNGNRAETVSRIAEFELAILQIDQDLRSEVAGELRDVQGRLAEYEERRNAALDALTKTELRAPQGGIVQQLSVHAAGALVAANEVVMMVVPVQERLFVDAQISPKDVDQIRVGQPVSLHFSAFNPRTTGTVRGEVANVSADRTVDARDSRIAYYTIRIAFDTDADPVARTLRLVPGMPVEAFLETEQRSVVSYFLQPLGEQMNRAFRER